MDHPISIENMESEKQLLTDFTQKYGMNSETIPAINIPTHFHLLINTETNIEPKNCYLMPRMDMDMFDYAQKIGETRPQNTESAVILEQDETMFKYVVQILVSLVSHVFKF